MTLCKSIISRHYSLVIGILFFVGFAIRTVGISTFPAGLNQDEASIGYETFSLLQSGADRNGDSMPIHFVSWGSGQNALYAYLSMPFVNFFGLNTFSIRIVNSFFSFLSLILFFLIFLKFFNKKFALVALALFVITPWSIMSARWGLESNIFPAIFLLGVYFLILGYESKQYFYLLSFSTFAISLYAYGTSYLVVPLFLLFIVPFLVVKKRINIRVLIFGLTLFAIIALPIGLFLSINHFNLSEIYFWNFTIPKLHSNRTSVIFNLFGGNFFENILKNIFCFFRIFILQTDGNSYNSIPIFGTIYPLSFVFLIIGIVKIIVNKSYKTDFHHYVFLVWLVCSVVLGVTAHTNINRISVIFIPMIYFVILGTYETYRAFHVSYKKPFKYVVGGYYILFFTLFVGYYFTEFNTNIKKEFSYGLGEAIQYADKLDTNKQINITTNTVNMPYIYVCFYTQMNPEVFRKNVVYSYDVEGFRNVEKLGRYSFKTEMNLKNAVHILSDEEMKYSGIKIEKSKRFGNYFVCDFN